MITMNKLDVVPVDAPLGAEVRGLDASVPPEPERVDDLKKVLAQYGVIVLRDQHLEEEAQQVTFTSAFGETVVPWLHGGERNTFAKIGELSPRPAYTGVHPSCVYWVNGPQYYDRPDDGYAQDWHSDVSYLQNPLAYSFLYALETTGEGYETWFNDQYAVYETLDEETRRRLARASISHDFKEAFPNMSGALHRIIWKHPISGRKAVFGIPGYDHGAPVGWTMAEWQPVLDHLWALIESERFIYKHQWRKGDLLIWDNRCVLHRRGPQVKGQTRILRRTVADDGDVQALRQRLLGL